jgi:hypothetical protein
MAVAQGVVDELEKWGRDNGIAAVESDAFTFDSI